MKKSKPLFKKMWMLFAFLFCSVVSANAATITYSLTTHVDGRTITGTANLSEGAALEDNMPQNLWRGYTTYKYYADADLTQEITTAPAEDATVYVDYVFDPPFILTEEGKDPQYQLLRKLYYMEDYMMLLYLKSGSGRDPIHLDKYANFTAKEKNAVGKWAFYGDGYSLNIRNIDANNIAADDYINYANGYATIGPKMEIGWQVYKNRATSPNYKIYNGVFSLGQPETEGNQLLYNANSYDDPLRTTSSLRDNHVQFNSKNELLTTGPSYWDIRNFGFYVNDSPITKPDPVLTWHVTYKLLTAEGEWISVVKQKTSETLTPTFPTEFEQKEGYTYDYFYMDENFKEKCAEGYTMPDNENTTLYIKESKPLTVTYKIIMAYQNNEQRGDDIVEDNEGQIPALNEQYKLADTDQYTYTYSYFKDEDLTKEYAEGETVNPNEDVIVYVKEDRTEVIIPEPEITIEREFTVGKWMTLVLPDYNLLGQNGVYGRFLDYVAVESHENAVDGYHWNCDLKFEEVGPNDLIPNRPYLFLPERIAGADNNARKKVQFSILESELGTPLTVSHVDPIQSDVTISMYGTYEDFELVPCEPQEPKGYKYIYFYFGNPAEGEYNFYTVEKNVTIAPTICYFDIKATKNAQNAPTIGGFGAKFSFFEGTNAINNIEGVKTGADKVYNLNGQQVQGNLQKGIYIVNGKKVLVK